MLSPSVMYENILVFEEMSQWSVVAELYSRAAEHLISVAEHYSRVTELRSQVAEHYSGATGHHSRVAEHNSRITKHHSPVAENHRRGTPAIKPEPEPEDWLSCLGLSWYSSGKCRTSV